jgi:hypothetical protein
MEALRSGFSCGKRHHHSVPVESTTMNYNELPVLVFILTLRVRIVACCRSIIRHLAGCMISTVEEEPRELRLKLA